MPSFGEPRGEQHAPIIGREAGLARLRGLMEQVPLAGQVLLVTGEAGMGKTVLLAGQMVRQGTPRAVTGTLRTALVIARTAESGRPEGNQMMKPYPSRSNGRSGLAPG
jgi:hypothetical protein